MHFDNRITFLSCGSCHHEPHGYHTCNAFTGLDSAGAASAQSAVQHLGIASGLVTTLVGSTQLNTGSVGNSLSLSLSSPVTLLAGDVLDFVAAFRHSTDSTGVSATVTLLTLLAGGGQPLLMNAGFETPVVGDGSFEYNPSGGASQGWSFDTAFGGGSGVSGNDSSFTGIPGSGGGNPSAPEGAQVAFLQVESTISQAITLYAAGTLQVSFLAAQRANNGTNTQAFTVSIGGTVVGPVAGGTTAFTPVGIDYLRFTTAPVLLPAGTHALTFTGLNPLGGDNTVFLDAVSLVFVPSSDDPFGYLGGLGYWQDPALDGMGMQYVRQRWLDTASGSWLSVDPVATEPRYNYARNSPTMRVDPSGMFSLPINASKFGFFLPAQASRELNEIQAQFTQLNTSLSTAIQKLFTIQQLANSQYEHFRRRLPPIIANLAPPPPGDFLNDIEWIGGVIVGALQSLIGLIPVAGLIPDLIDFIQYLIQNTPKEGFLTSIGHYFSEQWAGIVSLFTRVSDASAYERGKLFGSLLVNLVVAIIGIVVTVLTVGAGAPIVAAIYEEEGQDCQTPFKSGSPAFLVKASCLP